jgi:hypothetical protein
LAKKKIKNTGRGDLAPITDTFLPYCLIGLSPKVVTATHWLKRNRGERDREGEEEREKRERKRRSV